MPAYVYTVNILAMLVGHDLMGCHKRFVHGAERMNFNNFGDPFSFHQVFHPINLSWTSQCLHANTLNYDGEHWLNIILAKYQHVSIITVKQNMQLIFNWTWILEETKSNRENMQLFTESMKDIQPQDLPDEAILVITELALMDVMYFAFWFFYIRIDVKCVVVLMVYHLVMEQCKISAPH